jgi:hypothetical protein
MIWKLNHVVWTDQVLGARGSVPACARPAPRHIRWPEVVLTSDDHIETTCRWSIPLTTFGKAKASRYGKGRRGDPAAFSRKWLLRNRITSLLDPGSTNKLRLASLFGGGSPYLPHHRAPRLLSVTESIALPPRPKGRSICQISTNSIFVSGSCPRYCCRSFSCCWSPLRCLFNCSPPRWISAISSDKQLVRSDETNPVIVS